MATGVESHAQTGTLASWDFRTRGGQASVATTTAMSGVSATAPSLVAALGSGLTAIDYLSNGLTARNQTATSLAAAITGNDYISFTVTPTSGRTVSISSVKIRPVSQNRARSFTLMSSARGFTAGNEISTFTANANEAGAPLTTVSVTGHTNLTGAVEFRLYVYGHTDQWESAGIGNRAATLSEADLIVEGSLSTSTVAVTGVSVSPTSASLAVGGTQQLTATVSPADATNKNVTWSSSNTSVATVNAGGLVTGVAAGSATITVTTQDGARTAGSAITVAGSTVLRNPENPASTAAGLDYQYYEGTGWSVLPDFNALTAVKSGTVANFGLGMRNRDDNFGVSFTGFVNVPTDGAYTFFTSSDDGSKLFIGTTEVVSNDGLHAAQERSGSIGLRAGRHALRVVFFEATGGEVLSVSYSGPGLTKQAIPGSALSRATAQPHVVRELWSNVTGTTVAAIPVNTTPTATSQLTSLEGPTDVADNYGARIRGYITPATSGSYTFYIASDDNSELYLSTNDDPANKVKIAEVTDWTSPRQWTKQSTQTATPRSLTAGTRYYVEVLHKEGSGGDNLAVAWTGPGISAITVIGGNVLSPYTPTNNNVPVTGVSVSPATASVAVNATTQLTATVSPANATNKTVNWSSSNTGVATVSSSGLVTGVAAGTATITATTQDGNRTATSSITVTSVISSDAWPRVGGGLDGLAWWAPYSPFVDVVKVMRWNNAGSWDANGYPASASGGTVTGWAGYDNGTTWPGGDYVLTWEGSGDVVVLQNAVLKSESLTTNPKRRVYTLTTGAHGPQIQVNSFPAANIHLYLPGLENHTSLWNPDYVAYMEPFRGTVLRFMDLNGTNHSQQANWSDRTPRNWSTYVNANGTSAAYIVKGNASYEAMLELANQLDCDMWVTVPHLATDDYVQKLANLIKTGRDGNQQVTQPLKSNKKVWIEYSNEVWNWSFGQAQWVNNNTSIPGANVYQKYAHQAVRMFNIFRTAFADNARVRRILSTQTDWGDAWVTREYFSVINPRTDIDAVGVTTYFSHGLEQWMYDNWPVTQTQAIDRLRTLVGSGAFTANETVWANQVVAKQFGIAAEFGNIPLVAYEGNSHITPSAMITDRSGAQKHIFDALPESVNFMHQMERTTAFASIYNTWIRRYESTGNGVFKTNMPFVLVAGWSKWGQWGHVEYVGQTIDQAPKYKMLLDHYSLPYPVIRSAGSPRVDATPGNAAEGTELSTVFPNPTNGLLYIRGVKENAAVTVYNTVGQRVTGGMGAVVDMSKLAAGMYLVDVDGKRHKVIKN